VGLTGEGGGGTVDDFSRRRLYSGSRPVILEVSPSLSPPTFLES